tara:strand:+ start:30745 stop:31524 length:780 start_codon:yes stop_codon:yes gene_type:complete
MDNQITDFLYYVTIGKPHKNIDQKTKLKKALNKTLCFILNVPENTNTSETFHNNCNNNILSLKHYSQHNEPQSNPEQPEPLNDNINDHIQYISKIYEQIVQKYFLNSQYNFELTQDDLEFRKKLNQKGGLDSVSLIFPKHDSEIKKGITSIICLNGSGSGASVNIGLDSVSVLQSGDKYTFSDILIGFIDENVHIFKPESLKNIEITNNIILNNTNINTHLYRLLNPSFDVQKIKALQKLIQTNGLDFVINLFIKQHTY